MNTPDCRTVLQSAGLGMRGLRMSIQQHSSRHSWLSKELKHCIVDADWLLPSLIATNSLVRLSPLPFPSWARMKIRDNEVGKVDEGHNMFFCHSSCTFVLFHAPSPCPLQYFMLLHPNHSFCCSQQKADGIILRAETRYQRTQVETRGLQRASGTQEEGCATALCVQQEARFTRVHLKE